MFARLAGEPSGVLPDAADTMRGTEIFLLSCHIHTANINGLKFIPADATVEYFGLRGR